MPRPTPAQFAYGALTVVFTTLALLLLTQARSGTGIAVIAVAALALGLFVSLTAARAPAGAASRRRTVNTLELPGHHTASPDHSGHQRYRAPASLRQ